MELQDLFGLPAHPLIVHAAVVLLPLAAIATVVSAAVPPFRRHYAPIAFGLALLSVVAVGLAQGSGESLQDRVRETPLVEEHTEQAREVLPWSIGLAVVAGAVTAAPFVARRRPNLSSKAVTSALLAGAIVLGAGATWTVMDVGHSGAKATWSNIKQAKDNDR